MSKADTVDRHLTGPERTAQSALGPALAEWTSYLWGSGRVGTLAEARERCAPLEPAQTRDVVSPDWPMAFPAYVNPRLALDHQRRREAFDVATTLPMMTEAIAWMGARTPATMRGRDEGDRHSPHRSTAEWFRCSTELVGRLQAGFYVPVLTRLPGRPPQVPISERTLAAARARAALWVDPDTMVRVLRSLLETTEPTTLYRVARAEGRPLVLRRRGRPGRGWHAVLDLGTAAIPAAAVAQFIRTDGARLQVSNLSDDALATALARVANTYPRMLEPMDRIRPIDHPGQVRVRTWVRVSRAALGLKPWAGEKLHDEISTYRLAEYRTTDQTSTEDR